MIYVDNEYYCIDNVIVNSEKCLEGIKNITNNTTELSDTFLYDWTYENELLQKFQVHEEFEATLLDYNSVADDIILNLDNSTISPMDEDLIDWFGLNLLCEAISIDELSSLEFDDLFNDNWSNFSSSSTNIAEARI